MLGGGRLDIVGGDQLLFTPPSSVEKHKGKFCQVSGGADDTGAAPGPAAAGFNAVGVLGEANGIQQRLAQILQIGHAGELFHQGAQYNSGGCIVVENLAGKVRGRSVKIGADPV